VRYKHRKIGSHLAGIGVILGLLLCTDKARGVQPVHAQQAPTLITVAFGPQQVFPLAGRNLYTLSQQCPPVGPQGAGGMGSASCVVQVMQQAGATPDAIAFYLLTGRILLDFQNYDTLSTGTVSYNIWCCTADSSDTEPVILGGTPAVIYPLAESGRIPLNLYTGYTTAKSAFPNLSALGLDGIALEQVVTSPEAGDRFRYNLALVNLCRACNSGYVARFAVDFDDTGSFIGVGALNIVCRGVPRQQASQFGTCIPPSS